MATSRRPTDYALWAIAAVGALVPLGFVPLPDAEGSPCLWDCVRAWVDGRGQMPSPWAGTVRRGLFLLGPTLVIGWLLQWLAVVAGARLTPRPRDEQPTEDYADPGTVVPDDLGRLVARKQRKE